MNSLNALFSSQHLDELILTLGAATGRFFSYFPEEAKSKGVTHGLHLDHLVGDNPHCLQHECTGHCLLNTHFPFPLLDVLLQFFVGTLNYGGSLGSLFLRVSICLSTLTWGRDGNMLSCFSSFLKTICTLIIQCPPFWGILSLWKIKSRSSVSLCGL